MNILVVVDMQNDFITGALRNEEAIKIVPYVVDKVKKATEDENTVVVFTRDTHDEYNYMDTIEGKNLPVLHCLNNTEGWEIIDELKPYAGTLFNKNTFGSLHLGNYIGNLNDEYVDRRKKGKDIKIDEIEFIGVCTDICVISNVLLTKAIVPNVEIVVDAAGCAGTNLDKHDIALSAMESCHIKIMNKGKEPWREFNEDLER